jgi:hypothetical protein
MSFLDDVVDFGKSAISSVGGFLGGDSVGSGLARTALLGYANNRINKMINKDSDSRPSQSQTQAGTRVQVNPDPNYNVPVVYGNAYVSGAVTDARMVNNKQTMWFVLTICEKTGNKIDGTPSEISIQEVYVDGYRMVFKSDGITADYGVTPDGDRFEGFDNNIRVYPFVNGSANPANITSESNGNTASADNVMPNWTSNHTMDELVFALVRVDYDSPNDITGLGEVKFRVNNTMEDPGDCLFDYMTNTRYGAGVPESEVFSDA